MKASQNCIELIKRFEGFSARPYLCPAKVWTIGYGTTRGVTKSTPPITQIEAEALLLRDISKYEKSVNRLIFFPINQNQFDALVSFCYNLGSGALQRSSLRAKINRGELKNAAREFTKWVFAGGKKLRGLQIRRTAEQVLFLA